MHRMKYLILILVIVLLILAVMLVMTWRKRQELAAIAGEDLLKEAETISSSFCLTGAFLADRPTRSDIVRFQRDYGKKPYLVMVFTDWGKFIDNRILGNIYSEGSIPFITWEPWIAHEKKGIDYDKLLTGGDDGYIKDFARRLKNTGRPVFLRFAHEMNGNWYPWVGTKLGAQKYIEIYRYIWDIFHQTGVDNVKWVFSVNWEDVPPRTSNQFMNYYPGDEYVDYIGIDGYNWGDTQSWSKWMTFDQMFRKPYDEITAKTNKPIIISEFSSADGGGNKAFWIKEAMADMKGMKQVKAFILFNVEKETDWSFPGNETPGKEFRRQLQDSHFRDTAP